MKIGLGTTVIALALFLSACGQGGGQGVISSNPNEPTAAEVDQFLESKFPDFVDVEGVKIQSFIDPTSKQGRVSAKADIVLNETVYRGAAMNEVNDGYLAAGIPEQQRGPLYPPGGEPPFLKVVAGKGIASPFEFELSASRQVDSWHFEVTRADGNSQILDKGRTRSQFPANAIALDGPDGTKYFSDVQARFAAINDRDTALQRDFNSYFAPNKQHPVHITYPDGRPLMDIRFAADGPALSQYIFDGTHTITVTGYVSYIGPSTNLICTVSGGDFRSAKAQIVGKLQRDAANNSFYILKFGFQDKDGHYCMSKLSDARFQDGKVINTPSPYSPNWVMMK